LKYASVEELGRKIDEYFAECDAKNEPYTVTGLALALGLDRKGLLLYQGKNEYSNTIQKAKQKVQAYAERQLYRNGQVAGVIFSLKNNFGWEDKVQQEISGPEGGPVQLEMSDLSPDEKRELLQAALKNTTEQE